MCNVFKYRKIFKNGSVRLRCGCGYFFNLLKTSIVSRFVCGVFCLKFTLVTHNIEVMSPRGNVKHIIKASAKSRQIWTRWLCWCQSNCTDAIKCATMQNLYIECSVIHFSDVTFGTNIVGHDQTPRMMRGVWLRSTIFVAHEHLKNLIKTLSIFISAYSYFLFRVAWLIRYKIHSGFACCLQLIVERLYFYSGKT